MGKGKHIGLGVAALAAGAGVAALAAGSHKNNGERAQKKAVEEKARAEYRNTERGKHEKNSKGHGVLRPRLHHRKIEGA